MRVLLARAPRASGLLRYLAALLGLALLVPFAAGQGLQSSQDGGGAGGAAAGFGKPGSGFVELRLGLFDQPDNGDGNPFLDESLTVIEPILVFDYNFSERFGMSVQLSYDYVSSASIDRLSKFPEQSGASGDFYAGGDVAFRHLLNDTTRFNWHLGFSKEYDYTSLGLGMGLFRELPERNATVGLSIDAYLDQVDIIRFDGSQDEGSDDRTSLSATLSWYQIFSPNWHGELGLTLAHQSGFLETPYNAVVIEDPLLPPNPNLDNLARGYEITEELPEDRLRLALFGRARYRIDDRTAFELGGRVYSDDWGIQALTVEPRLYRELIRDELRLRLRYRFYTQTAADAFEESFTAETEHRTQDSDLGDFSQHGLGFQFLWRTGPASQVDFGADYDLRSDGLDHWLGSIGWRWSF